MNQQLFKLLSEFENWQDGHALNQHRLVQHDLVSAHLARLYSNLQFRRQRFGLMSPLMIDIDEHQPVAVSELLAITSSGKLLVAAKAIVPKSENPIENNGLFAIAEPLAMPDELLKNWPDFPLYRVRLEWQAWEAGIEEWVKTGEGLPLGRLTAEGQWDIDYIPPLMNLADNDVLLQQATELMNLVNGLAEPVFALQLMDLSYTTPQEFWQAHCRSLIALKTHPKLAADSDYQAMVSTLLSENFLPWQIGDGLKRLRSAWEWIVQRLNQPEQPAPKPRRYVPLGWYATSMALLAMLLGMGLVYQSNQYAQSMNELSKKISEVDDKFVQLTGNLSKVDDNLSNRLTQVDDNLSNRLTQVDDKFVHLTGNLSKVDDNLSSRLTQVDDNLSNRLTQVDDNLSKVDNSLSSRLTGVDDKFVHLTGNLSRVDDNLSSRLTQVDDKHVQAAAELSKVDDNLSSRLTQVDDKLVQAAAELTKVDDNLSKRLIQVDDTLSSRLTQVDDKLVQAAAELTKVDDNLSKRLIQIENRQTTNELSKRLIEVKAEEERRKAEELRRAEEERKKWSSPGNVFQDRLKDGSKGPEMVVIPAGTFRMGDIQGGIGDHAPVHSVTINSFAMGRYEVTFAEYDKFADATGRAKPSDSGWGRGNRPVINVSWHDATAYTQWLSEQTGHQYRLPTEAEWEYAARAGTETKYWWGNDIGTNKANCHNSYCGDSYEYTSPVGSFAANPFGLYDTAGNLWEWTCSEWQNPYAGKEQHCADSAGYFVLRGGAWSSGAARTRSADRNFSGPTNRYYDYGFRPARIK